MRLNSIPGKIVQLQRASPSLWMSFLNGWLSRRQSSLVPCVISGCRQLLKVPLKEFYESYQFFCEQGPGTHELDFFLGKLRPGDVFYDIGGFRGAYSAAAKLKLQAAVSVHIFEPLARNADAIQAVVAGNNFADFKINRLAVSDGATISGSVNEQEAMLRLGDKQATTPVEFASIAMDQYVVRGNPPPSVIKIDVDGFELHVLRSGEKTLRERRPRLWLEVHPGFLNAQGQSVEIVLKFLRNLGYTLANFDDFHYPGAGNSYHIWCE